MQRPEIENFILDGLPAAHAEYRSAPGLFRYAQSLENYIDWILGENVNQSIELINQRLELKKALKMLRDLADLQNGPPLHDNKTVKDFNETMGLIYDFLESFEKPQIPFYCRAWENEGFVCESQCLKCAKTREM